VTKVGARSSSPRDNTDASIPAVPPLTHKANIEILYNGKRGSAPRTVQFNTKP
jgi:hypothetical protein